MNLTATMGTANTGLVGTITVEVFDASSVSVLAATTAGITEIGATGTYQTAIQKTAAMKTVIWDPNNGSEPAAEDLTSEENQVFARNRNEANQGGTPRQTVYQDDDTTVYAEGNAYQNQAGTTPYAGKGIERRDRLT